MQLQHSGCSRFTLLDGTIPIFGVLQEPAEKFGKKLSVIRKWQASKSQSATETIRPLAITSWPSSTKINTEHLEQVLFSCQDLNCLTYRQRQLDDEQISDYSSTHHLCSQLQNLLLDIGLTLLRIFL